MKTTLIALAVTGAVLAGSPAAAEEMSVAYQDLNLATVQGQEALDRRIDSAARKVCGLDETITGTRLRSNAARRCYADAKAAAKKQLAGIVAEQQLGG